MHHQKSGRQLSRNTSHRVAMFRNMVDSLMEQEVFETTLPKAKELRRYADRVITLGKRGGLHARRRAATLVRRQTVVQKVFSELAQRYASRPGGYTRVLHLGPRIGDSAPMAIVELVDRPLKKAEPAKAAATGADQEAKSSKKAKKPAASKSAKSSAKSGAKKAKKAS